MIFWLGLGNPRHIATKSQQIKFWSILKKSWDWVRPPPSLGQIPNFYQKLVWKLPYIIESMSLHSLSSFILLLQAPGPSHLLLLLHCKCVPRLGLLRIGPLRSIHSTILSTWPSTFQNSTVSYHYITLQLNWATLSLRSQFSTVYFNCSEHASVWIWERMVVLLILFSH